MCPSIWYSEITVCMETLKISVFLKIKNLLPEQPIWEALGSSRRLWVVQSQGSFCLQSGQLSPGKGKIGDAAVHSWGVHEMNYSCRTIVYLLHYSNVTLCVVWRITPLTQTVMCIINLDWSIMLLFGRWRTRHSSLSGHCLAELGEWVSHVLGHYQ